MRLPTVAALIAITILGVASPVLAEAPSTPAQEPTSTKAVRVLLEHEQSAHTNDVITLFNMNDQITDLKKQVADLTKERDDLKDQTAKAAPAEKAKAATALPAPQSSPAEPAR